LGAAPVDAAPAAVKAKPDAEEALEDESAPF
jgi:hypothetical protein